MTTPLHFSRISFAALAASLALGSLAAHAKDVKPADEQAITVGMTRTQVREVLGKPLNVAHYALGNGSTWTYEIAHRSVADEVFDVDFAPDGTVKAAGEHMAQVE